MPNPENLKPFTGANDPRRSNGRPPGVPNSKTRLRRLLELSQDLKNPVTGEVEGFTVMEQIDMKLIQSAKNGNLPAIKELLDRLEGKPQQAIDHTTLGKELPTPILGGASAIPADDSSTETSSS